MAEREKKGKGEWRSRGADGLCRKRQGGSAKDEVEIRNGQREFAIFLIGMYSFEYTSILENAHELDFK